MQRNDTNGEVLMKAGCAASYAQLLGDITQAFSRDILGLLDSITVNLITLCII